MTKVHDYLDASGKVAYQVCRFDWTVDPEVNPKGHDKTYGEIRDGFETWKSMVAQVDCDAQPGGHLYIAHRPRKMAFLERECEVMREVFGYDVRMLSAAELRAWEVEHNRVPIDRELAELPLLIELVAVAKLVERRRRQRLDSPVLPDRYHEVDRHAVLVRAVWPE